jgi:hypothetical protein
MTADLRRLRRRARTTGPLLAAAVLQAAGPAAAASLTPPNLAPQAGVSNADLMLVWPSASAGPLQAITWANLKAQLAADLGATWLKPSSNLADLGNPTTARSNLGLGTAATQATGTSGASLCLLNAACSWSAPQTFSKGLSVGVQSGVVPSGGVITVTAGLVVVDTSAANQTVNTITGTLAQGSPIFVVTSSSAHSLSITAGGNILTGATCLLSQPNDVFFGIVVGSNVNRVACAAN